MGIILDSSILIAFERRRFDLERLLTDHPSRSDRGRNRRGTVGGRTRVNHGHGSRVHNKGATAPSTSPHGKQMFPIQSFLPATIFLEFHQLPGTIITQMSRSYV